VRIDKSGTAILNSKLEYSRCRLRLDMEGWNESKKKESTLQKSESKVKDSTGLEAKSQELMEEILDKKKNPKGWKQREEGGNRREE
jgi:hypothetical protein